MRLTRRKYLASGAIGIGVATAGCLPDSSETVTELPRPTLGSDDASVTVQLFEDYMCPSCAQFNETVQPVIIEEYVNTDDIQLEFYDWPIPVDPRWSYEVANAARAIQNAVGNDAYWDYSDKMFQRQQEMNESVIREEASNVGAENPEEIAAEARTGVYRSVIDADVSTGREQEVQGTPAVFVDGRYLPQFDIETVSAAIDQALEQA